jgi:hypothetical protein
MNFIPGWFPIITLAKELPYIVSENHTTSIASTITAPATINAGDLLVLVDRGMSDPGPPANVTPSGFTSIQTLAGSTYSRYNISYKIAVGNEDSSTITGINGSLANLKTLFRFVPSNAIITVTIGSLNHEVTDGNPVSQSCLASAGSVPLIVFGIYATTGNIDNATKVFNPAQDTEVQNGVYLLSRYKIYNTAPQNTTIDIDDQGSENMLTSFYLAVA